MTKASPIRVLIIDDSALARKIIAAALSLDPQIQVIGFAADPLEAREKIKQLSPDVLTLDIEMPNMNGLMFLERLMRLRPMPVVMVSSLTETGSDVTLLALEIGAIDVVQKPQKLVSFSSDSTAEDLRQKVKMAATTKTYYRKRLSNSQDLPRLQPQILVAKNQTKMDMIAIGSSTGGVEAIKALLQSLPTELPPIFVAQHMPRRFTQGLAQRLNETTNFNVFEASNGQRAKPGDVLIAPGGQHITVSKNLSGITAIVKDGEPVSGHMPSVNVLFNSVAVEIGKNSIGVILTGMGQDGAEGMLNMRKAGAKTIGQSRASCMIYGMPRRAAELGALTVQKDLELIPHEIINALEPPK